MVVNTKWNFRTIFLSTLLMSGLMSVFAMKPLMAQIQTQSPEMQKKATELFHKRYSLLREPNGSLKAISARFALRDFSLEPFLEFLKQELGRIQSSGLNLKSASLVNNNFSSNAKFSNSSAAYEQEVNALVQSLYENYDHSLATKNDRQFMVSNNKDNRIETLKESLLNLTRVDTHAYLHQVETSQFWKDFKSKIKEALFVIRPDLISVPSDPKFFFKKDVINYASQNILQMAARQLTNIPLLSTLTFVFQHIEGMIQDQRTFNQNYLLYLLENFKPETFGLTEKEVNTVLSSVYESRLGLMQYFQLQDIMAKWDSYGWGSFYTTRRTASALLQGLEEQGLYNKDLTKRFCYSFADVTAKDKRKIINLIDTEHQFSKNPALAYDFQRPYLVRTTRLLIQLGQFGLSFVPAPAFLKQVANNFAESAYKPQSLSEGALVAYFDLAGHETFAKMILDQAVNPYLK